ncbi:MAG: EF-hand domain-containing protein [Alphaproteobacteria bacterium]|nr:EF-hand domain-containing protein [Alphaproteobacteria bacterium]
MKKLLMLSVCAFAFSSMPALAGHHERSGHNMFEKMDADADGAVTKEEFVKAHEERFTKMDADGDGKVTKAEAEAAKAEMRKKHEEMKSDGADDESVTTDEAAPAAE